MNCNPPKPDAGVDANSIPKPPGEPDPGKETPFDAGVRAAGAEHDLAGDLRRVERRRREVAVGHHLQEVGAEYGTTTGRRRRCGWLDLIMMRYSCLINGYTSLNLTKLDVLDQLKELKVAVGYVVDGKELPSFPADLEVLAKVEVQYKTLPGWQQDISKAQTWEELPENCRAYVEFLEQFLGVKIEWIGVGPARESMIHRA